MKTPLLTFIWASFSYSASIYCPKPTITISEDECLVPVGINNFYEAQMDCINMGGYLPSVISSTQNEIVQQLANERVTCNGVWLGMDDRQFWTDGKNYSYENWITDNSLTSNNIGCVVLDKASGKWRNMTCAYSFAYFCTVPLNQTLLLYPDQNICINTTTGPMGSTSPTCPGMNPCGRHFEIISLLAFEDQNLYNSALKLLDNVTSDCGSKDVGYLITPNAFSGSCNFKKMNSKTFWQDYGNSYKTSNVNLTGQTVENMLGQVETCHSYKKNMAGIFYFMTDLSCPELCTPNFPSYQAEFIDEIMNLGYVAHFVQFNTDTTCMRDMFARCGAYANTQCDVNRIVPGADWIGIQPDLRTCNAKGVSAGLIVALVIVSILSLMGLIGIFYMRWRLQKAGGWKRFWKTEAQKESVFSGGTVDQWELEKGQLTVLEDKQLGSGAFAIVYEGILTGKRPVDQIYPTASFTADASGKVAVKRVPPHADWYAKKEFLDEIRFMKDLGSHSHILQMIGCITRTNFPLMCLELCQLGNLLSYVRSKKDEFTTEETGGLRLKDLLSIAWQVSDGLSYLKVINVIHRDLAARNILLTKSLIAKISDFGLCRLADSSVYISRGGRLPIKWMAIESLKMNNFSHQSDVWSFGVLLWEMFTLGEAPFPSIQPGDLLEHLESGERLPKPEICSPKIFKILESCWAAAPEERNDIEAIRSDLSALLHESSVYYGYVALPSMIFTKKLADLDEDAEHQGLAMIGETSDQEEKENYKAYEERATAFNEIRSVSQMIENDSMYAEVVKQEVREHEVKEHRKFLNSQDSHSSYNDEGIVANADQPVYKEIFSISDNSSPEEHPVIELDDPSNDSVVSYKPYLETSLK